MAWTLRVLDTKVSGDAVEVSAVLFGDSGKFVQSYRTNGTVADLTRQARATTAQREDRKDRPEELPIGLELDVTPPDEPGPPPDPTPEQLARMAFATAYRRLQALTRGLEIGVSVNTKALEEVLAFVRGNYLDDYEGLL